MPRKLCYLVAVGVLLAVVTVGLGSPAVQCPITITLNPETGKPDITIVFIPPPPASISGATMSWQWQCQNLGSVGCTLCRWYWLLKQDAVTGEWIPMQNTYQDQMRDRFDDPSYAQPCGSNTYMNNTMNGGAGWAQGPGGLGPGNYLLEVYLSTPNCAGDKLFRSSYKFSVK